ncbi:Uncharacterized membrane protein YjgN, DUF898 family [Bradyrhizobium lablabi]|uniref:Uncharacterized membrane protein YjgN, DUF898 family n=1 Tax=Bradyrhizobium lablabi TaxID=722472 RepID=A0A1M6PWE7_9BRAD|nr:DUF898 family protein [Bradyrhizobium lablabi]SHK12323.1 Uncharacterized membrane protein YjgN, DUF898 family [Bradyrhizobium lablabi]
MDQISLVPQAPPHLPVAFSGDRKQFFRLVLRGAGLELITVGFYRFWLATDIRRHLWSNTLIDGDAAEYTGRAKELLIGFLFALAIIVPVYLAYLLASLEAERVKAFASFPLLAFFYLFGQFAIYRARRYRLTRTVWRGVRFWMSGSGWAYAARAALWAMLVGLTLGLLLPWREAALERYKMRHSYYGDLQGSFEGRGSEFFKRGWWLWLLAPLYVTPLGPFVYGAFKAVEWQWWLSGIRFGDVRLESTMPRGALIGLYWKFIGWLLLLGLAFSVYVGACTALTISLSGVPADQFFGPHMSARNIPFLVLVGIGYLGFALAINVLMRVYLMRDLWVRVLASTNVHGIEAAANVSARGDLASALGEGIADGLDVAGF